MLQEETRLKFSAVYAKKRAMISVPVPKEKSLPHFKHHLFSKKSAAPNNHLLFTNS